MAKRVSAEDQIETIIEQARIVERKSVNKMDFLQDVSVLYLVGLRRLAQEIDQLHDRALGVVGDFGPPASIAFVPPPSIDVPVVEPTEFAAQLAELTSQVTKMTEAVEKLSKDLKDHSKDLKKLSKKRRKK
jgi:hypothetical protein